MKDLKDSINEQLNINEAKMKAEGPFKEAGNSLRMSVGCNRNTGVYTCYDRFIHDVDIIETDDIKTYLIEAGFKEDTAVEVSMLKSGYSYSQGNEYILTCLEEC